VYGGCASAGSARLILRIMTNGVRKKTSSQMYGIATATRCHIVSF
jgi:hypothetical protein